MDTIKDEDVGDFITIASFLDDEARKLNNSDGHDNLDESENIHCNRDENRFNSEQEKIQDVENVKMHFISPVDSCKALHGQNEKADIVEGKYYTEAQTDTSEIKVQSCLQGTPQKIHGDFMKKSFETAKAIREPSLTEFQKFCSQDQCAPIHYYDTDYSCREETVMTSKKSSPMVIKEFPTENDFISPPATPKAHNESDAFSQQKMAFDFQNDFTCFEDPMDISLRSVPTTPRVLCSSENNLEDDFSHQSQSPFNKSENYICDEATKKSSIQVEQIIVEECNNSDRKKRSKVLRNVSGAKLGRRFSNLSSNKDSPSERHSNESLKSFRKSCDSQLSESSSSIKRNIDSDSATSSSFRSLHELNSEDSTSPLLVSMKEKRDIFKDEIINEADNKESSASQYVHQAYDSDEENVCLPYLGISRHTRTSTFSDFELMLQKKKEEKRRSRKRGADFITSNDDLIDKLINRMEEAAYEDRQLNKKGLPAIKKISMLNYVVSQLRKVDLQSIFLEHNILGTLTEWLSPLPSKCLPSQQIRENILRLLNDFPRINSSLLRQSGIGKMLKFLREHPDETKENKEHCNQLILKWTHPMYDATGEYRAMTKRERKERDYELSLKYARQKSQIKPTSKKVIQNILDINLAASASTEEAKGPGEPGWVPRARVPQPSIRDYIKRPVSKLQCDTLAKTKPSRFETLHKKYQRSKREKLSQRCGAKLSITQSAK